MMDLHKFKVDTADGAKAISPDEEATALLMAERGVIAALMDNPQRLAWLAHSDPAIELKSEHFSNTYLRVLMALLQDLQAQGFDHATCDVLWARLNRFFDLEENSEAGRNWRAVLDSLATLAQPAGDELLFSERCALIAQAAIGRKTSKLIDEFALERTKQRDPNLLLAKLSTEVTKLQSEASLIVGNKLQGADEQSALDYFASEAQNRRLRCATGYRDLDAKIHGLNPGRLYMLAARPGMGKTTLGLNIMLHIASNPRKQFPVLVISLEMTSEQLLGWAMCNILGCSAEQLSAMSDEPSDQARREKSQCFGAAMMRELPNGQTASMLQICDSTDGTTLALRNVISKAVATFGGLSAVMIDYVQLMQPNERVAGVSRDQELGQIVQELKQLAQQFQLPFLVLSQLNRNIESHRRRDSRPVLSDLRESGRLEITSDVVMLLHRSPEEEPNRAWLILAKNRFGPTGDVELSCFFDYFCLV